MYSFYSVDSVKIPTLLSMGCASDTNETHFGPTMRNEYIIHYVVSGKGYFNGNAVEAGYGFLISPKMVEYYYADQSDPWSYLWIISNDPEMDSFFKMHAPDPKTGIFKFKNKHVVKGIIESMKLAKDQRFFSTAQLTEYFLQIYNNCVYPMDAKLSTNARIYFDFSVNYIDSHMHLNVSVEELCEKLGVSQPYLYKVFKSECGHSPKQYILERKLALSEELLRETDFSVSKISMSVGFCDVLAFSRFFSKKTGLSPSAYRKNMQTKE